MLEAPVRGHDGLEAGHLFLWKCTETVSQMLPGVSERFEGIESLPTSRKTAVILGLLTGEEDRWAF
jgi:hypothetical protein